MAAAALCALAAGCSEEPAAAPQPVEREPAMPASTQPVPPPAAAASAEPLAPPVSAQSGDAAALLRRYYALLEARRYDEAYALREPNGSDAAAFAAHFERFASHQVTIGLASEPVSAGGWTYVEVPVHSYGAMKDGKPFGSAGTVTLRRREGGAWRIYTK
jgi:hypothetical protein